MLVRESTIEIERMRSSEMKTGDYVHKEKESELGHTFRGMENESEHTR